MHCRAAAKRDNLTASLDVKGYVGLNQSISGKRGGKTASENALAMALKMVSTITVKRALLRRNLLKKKPDATARRQRCSVSFVMSYLLFFCSLSRSIS